MRCCPNWRDNPPPICVPAGEDEFWLLSKTGGRKLPVPPGMKNHGNFIVSLGAMCAWLAPQAEALGVEIYPGFAAAETLHDDDGPSSACASATWAWRRTARTSPATPPGIDITRQGHGARRRRARQPDQAAGEALRAGCGQRSAGLLDRHQGAVAGAGRTRRRRARSCTRFGWPADNRTYGGSFLYHLDGDRIALGYVSGLDYADPEYKPWEAFQQWKNHPMIKPLLEGGSILSAGARAIVTGGWQSLPKVRDARRAADRRHRRPAQRAEDQGHAPGDPLAACSPPSIWRSRSTRAGFDAKLRASAAMAELRKVRNIKPGFKRGLWFGMLNAAWETVTGGLSPWTLQNKPDWSSLDKIGEHESAEARLRAAHAAAARPPAGRVLRRHRARRGPAGAPARRRHQHLRHALHRRIRQPLHALLPGERLRDRRDDDGSGKRLQINAANCVHCKTCDIKDPYEIITWVTPEGGAGPNYQNL